MNRLREVLSCVALGAVIWLGCELAWTVRYERQRSVYTVDQLNKTLRETSQTMDALRKGATTWEQASKDQASKTSLAMSNVSAAAAQLTSFISSTNKSLNSDLLPTLKTSIEQQNAALLTSETALTQNLSELLFASQQLQKTLTDADAQIANPDIKIAVDNLATAAQNTASATDHADKTLASVQQGVEKEVHDILAPANKAKVAVMFIAQVAGRFLGY